MASFNTQSDSARKTLPSKILGAESVSLIALIAAYFNLFMQCLPLTLPSDSFSARVGWFNLVSLVWRDYQGKAQARRTEVVLDQSPTNH